MSGLSPNDKLYESIKQLIHATRRQVVREVNRMMVSTYYEIGRTIVENEQGGESRAKYSEKTLKHLSERLTNEFGKGFSKRNLEYMRRFYLTHEIAQTPSAQFKLSWSHYVFLMRIKDENERSFNEIEAAENNWSLKELKRQFDSALYERLALSKDKQALLDLASKGQIIEKPEDAIKDPLILEFLNLKDQTNYSETELEEALIDRLQEFLLELGKGFTFVARQKRISFSEKHFKIDLVFYNRILQSFVLIDLKIGELTHQDLGQLMMYVNYYDREVRLSHENKTIGLIICRMKNDAVVEYTLPEDNQQIFASRYQTVLPNKEALKQLME